MGADGTPLFEHQPWWFSPTHWYERGMATRTVDLERKDLDKSIAALSSAAQAFQLTRFERLSYRALMLSVDVFAVSLLVLIFSLLILFSGIIHSSLVWSLGWWVSAVSTLFFFVSMLVAIVSLFLNMPLFVRVFRQRARLKKLGLSSLSRSLWMESRRTRWISRARSSLLIGVGILFVPIVVSTLVARAVTVAGTGTLQFFAAAFYTISGAVLLAARYLRNQRERMDLSANAEELRNALQSLRHRAGDVEIVTVPSELVEQTAKIEAAQIAQERRDAVLQSVALPSNEYAIAFDRSAVEQRVTLGIEDRIELEDLVEQLSAEAAETQAGTVAGITAALRAATKSKRVEIDYLIDQASHRIRITAVRRGVGSTASPGGASHA